MKSFHVVKLQRTHNGAETCIFFFIQSIMFLIGGNFVAALKRAFVMILVGIFTSETVNKRSFVYRLNFDRAVFK